jgi:uncharacterized protein
MNALPLNLATSNTRVLKEIIRAILDGGDMGVARQDFKTKLTDMNHGELVAAVQQLEDELGGGAILIAEKRLKDFLLTELVAANVIKRVGSYPPGHPIQNYVDENTIVNSLCAEVTELEIVEENILELTNLFNLLAEVDIHYVRKENQLFPFLEAVGFTHPSTAMWQFHDDIRALVKKTQVALQQKNIGQLQTLLPVVVTEMQEMAVREELVLLPTAARLISNEEWGTIRIGEDEVGFMTGVQPVQWEPGIGGYLQHNEERMAAMLVISKDFIDGNIESAVAKELVNEQLGEITGGEFAFAEVMLEKQGVAQHALREKIDALVAIYKDALGTGDIEELNAGHPVHSLRKENRAIQKLIEGIREKASAEQLDSDWVKKGYEKLMQVVIHYARKENQLFPYLEKKNFNTPSTIMWTLHDDIRESLKYHKKMVERSNFEAAFATQESLFDSILEMIFKEEKILFPVCLELIPQDEWIEIRKGEDEIGYCLIPTPLAWPDSEDAIYTHPSQLSTDPLESAITEGLIGLDEGLLSQEQIRLIFTFLPVDVTFTDENNIVRFYNKGDYRIFPRSPGIIGREVRYCHPPKSVDMVLQIIEAFRTGKKDMAEFWIQIQEQFIHIRFFALRDKDQNYKGVLEIMQEVAEIRKLEGNKRLLDWE